MAFRMKACAMLSMLFLLLAFACNSAASHVNTPMMGVIQRERFGNLRSTAADFEVNDGFQILNYTQTLDHFNYQPESYATFQQRYAINFKFWGGANASAPIFMYTGDEASLEGDMTVRFLIENAPRFKALLVFIEHRYYGKSVPFGSWDEAYRNASTLGYFSSSQALADYAQLIIELKKNLSAENCPVIAMGGSYGGMLAAWFRLKYPHVAIGALASSAPILYFEDITPQDGYYSVVTKDFRETSESCYQTIRQSWLEIDKVASQPNGLAFLSQIFKTCRPLNDTQPIKDILRAIYSSAAQYDDPQIKPVEKICQAIDSTLPETDVLGRIASGFEVAFGKEECHHIGEPDNKLPPMDMGWFWQTCTEMVMPIGCGENDTMFQARPFDFNNFTKECQETHGVTPRPHWITTEFGGHNIKSVLERFGSNIIFSNGLRDPYSSGGVLFNISDSIVALYTTQGSHCLDIITSSKPSDPEWLISQRNSELNIIEGWIAQYYANATAGTNAGTQN